MSSDPLLGRVLANRYRIDKLIGEGGMGAVYQGEQLDLKRRVAIKVLRPEAAGVQGLQRFQREARAAAALHNPHIVQVSDFQLNPGEPPFLVMDLLEGQSLLAVIGREGRVDPRRVVHLTTQVLAGLSAAHAAGIVHRDIKPENIFITRSAVGELVKIVDFGIAKLYGDPADSVTRHGALIGSVFYMSPEQAAGKDVDPRSDIFSLSVCMYHALTGQQPFQGSTVVAVIRALSLGERRPLHVAAPHLDAGLVAIVERGLSMNPNERFQHTQEMIDVLQRWHQGGLPPHIPPGVLTPAGTAQSTSMRSMPVARSQHQKFSAGTQPKTHFALALVIVALVAFGVGGAILGSKYFASRPTVETDKSVATQTGVPTVVLPLLASPSSSLSMVERDPVPSAPPKIGGKPVPVRDGGSAALDAGTKTGQCKTTADCGGVPCEKGVCVCSSFDRFCNGRCVAKNSPSHCGACGVACKFDETCFTPKGESVAACIPCGRFGAVSGFPENKYERCGAPHWCNNLSTEMRNCGACGQTCERSCFQGKCR